MEIDLKQIKNQIVKSYLQLGYNLEEDELNQIPFLDYLLIAISQLTKQVESNLTSLLISEGPTKSNLVNLLSKDYFAVAQVKGDAIPEINSELGYELEIKDNQGYRSITAWTSIWPFEYNSSQIIEASLLVNTTNGIQEDLKAPLSSRDLLISVEVPEGDIESSLEILIFNSEANDDFSNDLFESLLRSSCYLDGIAEMMPFSVDLPSAAKLLQIDNGSDVNSVQLKELTQLLSYYHPRFFKLRIQLTESAIDQLKAMNNIKLRFDLGRTIDLPSEMELKNSQVSVQLKSNCTILMNRKIEEFYFGANEASIIVNELKSLAKISSIQKLEFDQSSTDAYSEVSSNIPGSYFLVDQTWSKYTELKSQNVITSFLNELNQQLGLRTVLEESGLFEESSRQATKSIETYIDEIRSILEQEVLSLAHEEEQEMFQSYLVVSPVQEDIGRGLTVKAWVNGGFDPGRMQISTSPNFKNLDQGEIRFVTVPMSGQLHFDLNAEKEVVDLLLKDRRELPTENEIVRFAKYAFNKKKDFGISIRVAPLNLDSDKEFFSELEIKIDAQDLNQNDVQIRRYFFENEMRKIFGPKGLKVSVYLLNF